MRTAICKTKLTCKHNIYHIVLNRRNIHLVVGIEQMFELQFLHLHLQMLERRMLFFVVVLCDSFGVFCDSKNLKDETMPLPKQPNLKREIKMLLIKTTYKLRMQEKTKKLHSKNLHIFCSEQAHYSLVLYMFTFSISVMFNVKCQPDCVNFNIKYL